MSWHLLYLMAWLAAALLGWLATWCCRWLAPRWGFVDKPKNEAHKNHRQATPVLGGLGMCLAWLAVIGGGIVAVRIMQAVMGEDIRRFLPGIASVKGPLLVIMAGSVAITALGILDDRKAMKALPKFLGQALIAGVTAWLGVRVTCLGPNPVVNWLVTTLWIMTVINALNFFDNMDGLAGGTAMIAAFFLLFIAAIRGQHFVAMLAAVTSGVSAGFLLHNAPPARIFMGDGGSHFLGYGLGVMGALTTFYVPGESPTPAPLLIPLLVLLLPLFDAVAVVCIRLRAGLPIYVGDNRHISHRFVQLGLSRPSAVLLVCLLCFIGGAGALTLLWLPPSGILLIMAQLAAMLAVISIIQFNRTKEQ